MNVKVSVIVKGMARRSRHIERLVLKRSGFCAPMSGLHRPLSGEKLSQRGYDYGKVAVDQTRHHVGRLQAPERKATCKYQGRWRRDLSRVSVKAWASPSTLSASRVADRTVLHVILHELLADRQTVFFATCT
jgi:hypothetical protein